MTSICPTIRNLERDYWYYLSDVFSYQLKASELGFTDHLIYFVASFFGGWPRQCEVYAFHAPNEKLRGADIDLFIQDTRRTYHWYMLQAKMMNHRGEYRDISKWGTHAQFNKLINMARSVSAFPLYLLYNGMTIHSRLGSPPFGISLFEASAVRALRRNQYFDDTNAHVNHLTFDLLFSVGMDPFHILFCDGSARYVLPNPISGKDIYRGYPYVRVTEQGGGEREQTIEDLTDQAKAIIIERTIAPYRIVVNRVKLPKEG